MRAARLHPELRSAFRFLPNPPVQRRWFIRLARRGTALIPAPRTSHRHRYERVDLGSGVAVHTYTPASGGHGGALLWIHGGGMVIGAAAQDHAFCADVAADLDVTVVSVDYRLAPEHPYPTPVDDCVTAWRWLVAQAPARGIDQRRIAVGGQSAGGGLAASLVHRVHDGHDAGAPGAAPAAQWLFCPMLDDRTAARRDLDGVRHVLWHNRSNRAGWSAYLGVAPGSAAVPDDAVPARCADLTGLPPTWIGIGDADLFCDEACAYAGALAAAGVPTTLDIVPGAPHAFERIAARAPVSRAYLARAKGWLRQRLAPA
jgi:acetyl esterase/lipase